MIQEGTYRARAVEAALGHTLDGAPQIAVAFTLLDSDESITWYGYFTERTQKRTIESLRNCGWEGDDLSELAGLDANEVSLVIKHETYQGVTSARVAWVNRPGEGGIALKTRMDPAQAKAFARSMMGAVLAAKGPVKTTAPPRNGAAPPARTPAAPLDATGTDDEIPF